MLGASGEVLAAVRSNQSHTSQREAFLLCCVQGGPGQPLGRLGLSTCCAIEDIDGEVQASQAMGVMVVPDMHMGVSGRIRGHFHSWRSEFGSQQSARRWTENSSKWARHK